MVDFSDATIEFGCSDLAVTGLAAPGVRIKNPACVSKTFPAFFDVLDQLRQG